MPRFCRESENRAAGAGETTHRRPRIRAIAGRQRADCPNLQRTGRRNEQGFPRTVSGQSDAFESAAVCILPAGTAADPLGRQRWFVDEQIVWHLVLIDKGRSDTHGRAEGRYHGWQDFLAGPADFPTPLIGFLSDELADRSLPLLRRRRQGALLAWRRNCVRGPIRSCAAGSLSDRWRVLRYTSKSAAGSGLA